VFINKTCLVIIYTLFVLNLVLIYTTSTLPLKV